MFLTFNLDEIETEVLEYRRKINDEVPFIPVNWLPEDFTMENLRDVFIKAVKTGRKFEEYMPKQYRDNLKEYNEGIEKGYLY